MKRSLITLLLGLVTALAIWYGLSPSPGTATEGQDDTSYPLIVRKEESHSNPTLEKIQTETPAVEKPAAEKLSISKLPTDNITTENLPLEKLASEKNTPEKLDRPLQKISKMLSTGTLLALKQPMEPFSLTDTQSQAFDQTHFQGQWTLLFFGYANCPDVCPRSLAIATDLFKKLQKDQFKMDDSGNKLLSPQLIFVTLNPKKDSVVKLKNFLSRFNPNFIGLTGQDSEISKLAKYCRVYHVEDPNTQAQGQNVIDHTAAFILINPQGRLHALFSPPHNSELIAKDLDILMKLKTY